MAHNDFGSVPTRDLMQTDVYRLDPGTPIEEALAVFEDLHISGAPVVDEFGHVIGVLSAFDVARPAHIRGDRIETGDHEFSMLEPADTMRQQLANDDIIFAKDMYSTRLTGGETVADWMSYAVISISPDTPLRHACRAMVREDIRRVFVIEKGQLVGVLSSFDVVRYIAGEKARERGSEQRGHGRPERSPTATGERGSRSTGEMEARPQGRKGSGEVRGQARRNPRFA